MVEHRRNHLKVHSAFLVGQRISVQLHLVFPEHAPAFVAVDDDHTLDWVTTEIPVDLGSVVIEILERCMTRELAGVVVECNCDLGFPGNRIGILELRFAAHGLDRLSTTAIGPVSSARTGPAVVDAHMIAKAAQRNRFITIILLVRGSCQTRTSRVPVANPAVAIAAENNDNPIRQLAPVTGAMRTPDIRLPTRELIPSRIDGVTIRLHRQFWAQSGNVKRYEKTDPLSVE